MSEIRESQGHFVSADGVEIFSRTYTAVPERGRVVLAHGLGEHSGRYGNVVNRLVPEGISIYMPDHRGHGKSGGKRGHVTAFADYVRDLKQIVLKAAESAENSKPILLGHSLGGLIAVNFALDHNQLIGGLVLSSPGLGVTVNVPWIKSTMGRIMSKIRPEMTLKSEVVPEMISHDKAAVDAYKNDPLVHNLVSARWFTEFMAAMERAQNEAASIATPILMQVAEADRLVSPAASRRFFEKLTIPDKTWMGYDKSYHEIYNEIDEIRNRALDDLLTWINRHL